MIRRWVISGGFPLIAWTVLVGAGAVPQASREHWSYQPPVRIEPPHVVDTAWPRGAIDRFILAKLEQAELKPAADADPTTLVRRIYFDLIGLPPTVEQVSRFVANRSEHRVAELVDELLESRQFGERWGRHWLDVARYADSSGGGRSLLFPNAWRFRDYVIESFQRDKPFDQFVREQIAGDLLPFQDDAERTNHLIATAFLMIGAHNYELQDKDQLRMDVVDEQIEAVGRAFLGQTLGCARCHDHKFDPIPTTDYYALAGILRSTKSLTPGNVSGFEQHELPVSAERRQALDSHAAAMKTAQERIDTAKADLKVLQASAHKGSDVGAESMIGHVVDDTQAKVVGNWTNSKYNAGYVGEGYIHDGAAGKGEKSVTFPIDLPHDGLYEVRVSYTHGTNRSPSVPVTIHFDGDQETVQIDQRMAPPIDGRFVALGRWRFTKGISDAVVITNEATTGYVIVDAVQLIPVELLESNGKRDSKLNDLARAEKPGDEPPQSATATNPDGSARTVASVKEAEARVKRLEAELKQLKERAPPPAPLTMGVKDERETGDFRVCLRGIVHNLGDPVHRSFLTAASRSDAAAPKIAGGQSGRLELAEWLASPANPLTARVAVNRIWQHLFGNGLVRTPDNFGTTGESPTHPELLDWLALRFIDLGWSHKRMIREIVLSRSYQMASRTGDASNAVARGQRETNDSIFRQDNTDPSNRLLSRQNRKRLDAECLYDAILSISGQLDPTAGGPAIRDKTDSEYGYKFDSRRRAIYSPVFRNNLPEMLDVFDFADPNIPTGRRNVSTLPSQALFLMNSPFVMDAAQHAAGQLLELDISDAERIELAYRRALGRLPSAPELQIVHKYLEQFQSTKADDPTSLRIQAWSNLWQVLIASVEFRFSD